MADRMILGITGGRKYNDRATAFALLDRIHAWWPVTRLVHGNASGADTIGKDWTASRGIPDDPYPALWDDISIPGAVIRRHPDGRPYNVMAGHQRNQRMVDVSGMDILAAFPGNTGTADMVRRATDVDMPVAFMTTEASLDSFFASFATVFRETN